MLLYHNLNDGAASEANFVGSDALGGGDDPVFAAEVQHQLANLEGVLAAAPADPAFAVDGKVVVLAVVAAAASTTAAAAARSCRNARALEQDLATALDGDEVLLVGLVGFRLELDLELVPAFPAQAKVPVRVGFRVPAATSPVDRRPGCRNR